jgi:hypothetical protein
MSVSGLSRHFAAMQHFSRTWSEADINWQAKPANSVENGPIADIPSRKPWPVSHSNLFQSRDLRPMMRFTCLKARLCHMGPKTRYFTMLDKSSIRALPNKATNTTSYRLGGT